MVILHNIKWPRKNIKRLGCFSIYEIRKLVLKSLLNNIFYDYKFKIYFSNLFYNFDINSSISRYRSFCMLQVKGNSIFRIFKLSRYRVHNELNNGYLTGFRKSSF